MGTFRPGEQTIIHLISRAILLSGFDFERKGILVSDQRICERSFSFETANKISITKVVTADSKQNWQNAPITAACK